MRKEIVMIFILMFGFLFSFVSAEPIVGETSVSIYVDGGEDVPNVPDIGSEVEDSSGYKFGLWDYIIIIAVTIALYFVLSNRAKIKKDKKSDSKNRVKRIKRK